MTRLLDFIAPYPPGYVSYRLQTKIDLRRAYLKGAILGLIVGFLIGFGASLYWREMQIREAEAFYKEMSQKVRVAESKPAALRESLGNEVSKRTMAENELRKMGVMVK
jgi:predicted negative regulator of RcsB-dependent stress response